MKKFFKTLALVLALALVVGILPATSASAASVKKNKTLYVNGPQGASTTDETAKSSYQERVAIYRLAGYKKATAEGHTFEAKIVSGEDWVTVGKKYVKAIGYSNGKAAVVEIYVDGELAGKTNIKTRVNASKDTLSILCNDGELPEKFIVGAKYTFALPRAKKDSDERRLFINGTQLKDIEGKDRQYEYTFAKADAGKNAVIKYEAFQSETLDKATVSSGDIEIPVGFAEAKEAKQTAAAEVTVTFKDFAEGYAADDFSVYYLNAAGVKITDKVVKSAEYDKENNAYVVTVYSDFVKGTEYHVVVGDSDVTFTAKSNTVKDVDHFEINEDTIIVGGFQNITFTYYDAEGMKLDVNPGTTLNKVSATADTAVAANTSVYLAKAGDSIVVKGVFYTIDDNYNSVPHYSVEKTITGVDATSAYTPVAFTLTDSATSLGKKSSLADYTISHSFKNGDTTFMHVILSYTDNASGKVYYIDAADASIAAGIGNLKFSSAAEKVIVADTTANAGKLNPVAASGNATIVVKDKDGGVIYAGEVEMGAKRYFYAFDATLSKSTFNATGDTVTLKLTAYDQYNDPWKNAVAYTVGPDATVSSDKLNAPTISAADTTDVASKGITKYTISAYTTKTGAENNTAYTGVIKVATKQNGGSWADLEKKIGLSVSNITEAENSYQWTASGNSYDMALTRKTLQSAASDAITFQLAASYNGYSKGNKNATFANEVPVTTTVDSDQSEAFVYTVAKDGKAIDITSADYNKFITGAATGLVTIKPYAVSGGAITKMPKGTYTVVAYKKSAVTITAPATEGTQVVSVLATATVTINDTQVMPAVSRTNTDKLTEIVTPGVDGSIDDGTALLLAKKYFTASFGGKDLDDALMVSAKAKADASGAVVITEVKVAVKLATTDSTEGDSATFIELKADGLPMVIYK
jgi:hypothetical protein